MKIFMVETSYFQSVLLLIYVFAQELPSHTYAVAMSLYQIIVSKVACCNCLRFSPESNLAMA